MVWTAGWCRCEEKTDSNSTNSAGRDAASKAPSLSCRVTVFSLLPACIAFLVCFSERNKTKMAAVAQGRSCSDKEEQEKVVCKTAAILRSRPLAALPMTFQKTHPLLHMPGLQASVIYILSCVLNWTTLSIVMRLWAKNWTHAVEG